MLYIPVNSERGCGTLVESQRGDRAMGSTHLKGKVLARVLAALPRPDSDGTDPPLTSAC